MDKGVAKHQKVSRAQPKRKSGIDEHDGTIWGVDFPVRTDHRPPRLGKRITVPAAAAMAKALTKIEWDERDDNNRQTTDSSPQQEKLCPQAIRGR